MSDQKKTAIAGQAETLRDDDKLGTEHVEQVDGRRESQDEFKGISGNRAADNDARNYLNPDIVISPELNKKLRRRIHKR